VWKKSRTTPEYNFGVNLHTAQFSLNPSRSGFMDTQTARQFPIFYNIIAMAAIIKLATIEMSVPFKKPLK
jgi:hypothetical protein